MKIAVPAFLRVRNLFGGAIFLFAIVAATTGAIILAQQYQESNDKTAHVSGITPRDILDSTQPKNIAISFNKDLVGDDSLNILFADMPFVIEPPIAGLGKWTDNNILIFYPDSAFRPSTEYTISIKSERTYLNGLRIEEPRTFKFRTPVFAVTHVWTEITNVPDQLSYARLAIHINFNYVISPDEFMANFSTTLPGQFEPMTRAGSPRPRRKTRDPRDISWVQETGPTNTITLLSEPFKQKEMNGSFEFTIKKGFGCIGCQIALSADYKHKFDIPKPEPLVVNSVNSYGAGPNCQIIVQLSQSVSFEEFRKNLSITPSIKYTVEDQYYSFSLVGDFHPRETYSIAFKKGMTALNGQELERDFSTIVQIGDLQPRISFLDQGHFLSKEGGRLLEVETVNIPEITVEVEQVFVNNIVYYLSDYGRYYYGDDVGRVGRKIFSKDYKLNQTQNVPLKSTIDLGKIVGDTLGGIYSVAVRQKDQRWIYDHRRVMISDLGILARLSDNYLMVWVNTLSDTKPVTGATVTLMSRNNQAMLEGRTDSRGVAVFEDIAGKRMGFEPFVITVTKGNDLSYLLFNECMISTTEFDVGGRPYLSRGYEAFIYSDRGVYRPGETVHLVSVVRGVDGKAAEEFPYVMEVKDPQGRDFTSFKLSTKNQAVSAIDLDIPSFAKTGGYLVLAKIGEDVIGQYQVQVEEFMPDRIKTTLTTDKDVYDSGEEATISVNGAYLFGPPASGNTVNGHVTIESDFFGPREYSSFTFYDSRIEFTSIQADLPSSTLDLEGNHNFSYMISNNLRPPSSLKMSVSATVLEEGGRGVSAYKTVAVNPYPVYFGLRQTFEGYAQSGSPAEFEVVALDGRGRGIATDSVWVKFYRIIYQTILKRDPDGIYRYVSEEEDNIIDSTLVSVSSGPTTVRFTPSDYGAYRVTASGPDSRHSSALTFYAPGWGYSPWSMADPEKIELTLDKKTYAPGQKAKLLVKAPFEGKLLLTIEKDKVLDFKTYSLDSNTAEIELAVDRKYFPNAYISATLIKSTTSLERFSPARAFGLIPLMVESGEKRLALKIDAADVIKPRSKLDVTIKTAARKGTMITVAAVDLGILQLTGFGTPDPFEYFYGKKRPALNPYDIYSLVLPDVKPSESNLSPAGSAAYEAARKRHLNPISARRVKPVALWSGVVSTDDGTAHVSFDIPQFNGKIVIMAVGFNGEMVGSATDEVTVRDNIIIQESLPRFIAPGDEIKTGVVVFNNTGKEARIEVGMDIKGSATVISDKVVKLDIPNNSKATAQFMIEGGNKPGKVTFDIIATDGTERAVETVELANRPGQPILTKHGSGAVKAGSPARLTLPSNWLDGTAEYSLRMSSMPQLKLAGGLQYILQYPHGCIEQTSSKLFTLLYFNDLAKFALPEIYGTKAPDYFITEGIQKLANMQLPSGEFAFWLGGSDVSPWGSVYASHFLVEARKAGYIVSEDVYDKMISNLQRITRENFIDNARIPLRVYAAYVLAKAGELDRSALNSLKQLNIDIFPIYSRFQLAGAIAQSEGIEQAMYLIPVQVQPVRFEPENGGNFNSDVRTNAMLLEVLLGVAPDNPSVEVLAEEISERLTINPWYTTQSNAWALMALGKFFKNSEIADYNGAVIVDGKRIKSFGTEDVKIAGEQLAGGEMEISINGSGTCYYFWQASGIGTGRTVTEFSNRVRVSREYLDSDGKPLNADSIHLGDQLVAKITAEALDKPLEYVAINDLLPSCFEIENPRLQTTGRLAFMPSSSYTPQYVDIRDDRLLLFSDLQPKERFVYYYSIRVISRGEFSVPPTAAECMYDPTIAGAGSSGNIKVGEAR
jgi:hypothetical protein